MKHLLPQKAIITIGIFALLSFGVVNAQVCRVSVNGTTSASGATWQQTKNLQSALNNPAQCPEIWVKSGTYYPTASGNRNTSFRVQGGVKLFGGFYGTEISRTQRDYINNKAILSGNIGSSITETDNSHHVIYLHSDSTATQIGNATEIDGFIIEDGYSENTDGGGLVCSSLGMGICSPYLKNLVFRNNFARNGGAVFNLGKNDGHSRPIFENIRFINNNADSTDWQQGNGGAVYNLADGESSLVFPVFDRVEFSNNQASENGGAIANRDFDGEVKIAVNKGTFANNIAKNGGAVGNKAYDGSLSFRNSTFYNNTAEQGGAIYNEVFRTPATLNNVTLSNNSATVSGGALHYIYSDFTVNNTILWDNTSPLGSQIYIDSNEVEVVYSVLQHGCNGIDYTPSSNRICQMLYTSDPNLGNLTMNRGFTKTMLPGAGSSAINHGDTLTCENVDQRGIVRPQNGQCDIGAVEVLNECRVTTGGTAIGNGSDWSGQAMALQTALTTPSCREVWIKTGTYKPTNTTNRSLSFTVQPGVTVIGGFAGTEDSPDERDVDNNPVILSGDIGNANDPTDNSYHVLYLDGTQGTKILANTVIMDLEIHDGYGSLGSFDFPNNSGAGLFCDGSGAGSACSPYLTNIRFYNNQTPGGSGGALFNQADNEGESNPQLVNVKFEDNTAEYNGGAMYNNGLNSGDSSPVIVNGTFLNNTAGNSGGAIYNNGNHGRSSGAFLLSQFSLNQADYGGAVYNSGQDLGMSNPVFSDVTFISNVANYDGGAVYSAGWNSGQSQPVINKVTFKSNMAIQGGALFLHDSAALGTAQISNSTFDQNSAVDGGALYNDGENGTAHPMITNTTFYGNSALDNGGAIHNNGENGDSSPDLLNVTFSGNQANYGAAMFSTGGLNGVSSPTMRHIIMWGNTATTEGNTIYHSQAESTIDDSIIEYGCPNVGFGNTNCTNIIDQDPLLGTLADNGGFSRTMLPATNSPAIDAGDNSYCPGDDQRGESRPKGAACDIGAVEVDTQGPSDIIFKDGFD